MAIDKLPTPSANYKVVANDTVMRNKTNEIIEEVNDHSNKLLDLLARFGLIADYPIEKGSNENGSWEKWHSGKLVQWGYGTTTTTDGNLRTDTKAFPIPFLNSGYIVIGSANTTAVANIESPAFSRTSEYEMLVSIVRKTAGNVAYFWHATGNWK